MYTGLRVNIPYSCQILMKLLFSRQIFQNYSNSKSNENPTVEAELFHVDGQTDPHDEANTHFSQFCERAEKFVTSSVLDEKGMKGRINMRMS
jgi:hypothetical protein